MGVTVDEVIMLKSGPELFRELLRMYPVAEFEDYYKGGQWKDEMMKTDLTLIYAHAREAGAPYPPPLKDVKLPPNVPNAVQLPSAASAVRPALSLSGVVRPVVARPPVPVSTPATQAVATTGAPELAATPTATPTPTSSQATELRLIALFVAKWKVDPTRTKLMLAKLSPPRRRYVISNFKNAGSDPTFGLEQFISKCEETDAWAADAGPGGMKRPLTSTTPVEPSKVPRLNTPGAVPPKAGVVRPMGAVRPLAAPGGLMPRAVRPPGLRPAGLVSPRG